MVSGSGASDAIASLDVGFGWVEPRDVDELEATRLSAERCDKANWLSNFTLSKFALWRGAIASS